MTKRFRELRRTRGEEGFTLTEMIVVIMILGLVLAAVQTTLIVTNRTVGDNGRRVDQTSQARTAIDSMSKVLRTAVLPSQLNGTCSSCDTAAFIQGTSTSVQFYADLNNDANIIGPSRVTYSLVGGVLSEAIQPPNAHAANDYNYQYCTPGAGCVVPSRVLARGVGSAAPIFTYYDKNGVVFPDSTLTATELAQVDSIDIVVSVRASTQQTIHGTTLTTRVTLPNADSVTQPTATP